MTETASTVTVSAPAAKIYDLEERTARFSEAILAFARKVPVTPAIRPLISQLVEAATSIGANYCEADDAESKRDFIHKIGICRKEARETKYWLRLIGVAVPSLQPEAQVLWREAKELHLIFIAILRSSRYGRSE